MNETRYLISDASKKLHVETHVLRYWEEELGMDIPRNELGHRYYTEKHLLLFERIKQLKEAGYLLKAIKLILPRLDRLDDDEFEFISLVADEMNRIAAEQMLEAESCSQDADSQEAAQTAAQPAVSEETDFRQQTAAALENGTRQPSSASGAPDAAGLHPAANESHTAAAGTNSDAASGAPAENRSLASPTASEASKPSNADSLPTNVIPLSRMAPEPSRSERLQEFQTVMTNVVSQALQQQAGQFGNLLSDQIGDRLLSEIDALLRLRQEQEELHFQQLDETLRSHQRAMQEAAASRSGANRRKRRK